MPWVHPGNGSRTPPLQSFEESLTHQNPLKVLYFENSRRRRPFQCCHDRTEIDCTFSNSRMAVSPAIVIMDMHMREVGLKECRQAVVQVRMPAVEAKPGIAKRRDIVRGPEMEVI